MIPNQGKVLVDFYADWCQPCTQMNTVLEDFKVLNENASGATAQVVKINVDQNRELAQQYGVRGIPCFVVVNDGAEINRATGMQTLQQLKDLTK
tara:strand:+ start:1667 stop:1948 length:282 start_codon:yes stop_codon:yes gene_type:complete